MRRAAIIMAGTLLLAGCGGGSDHGGTAAEAPTGSAPTAGAGADQGAGKLPPSAVGPPETAEEQAEGPAATEAAPESAANGPASEGELPSGDRSAAEAAVRDYISALDRHDGARVCALLAPGAFQSGDLPRAHGGCHSSVRGSIGAPPRSGGPVWRRTALAEVKAEDLGGGRARVSATVVHHFADRKYVSVEDDVIYLERVGGRWLLAKPSGTFYRAVGYPEPPLRALTPPPGW